MKNPLSEEQLKKIQEISKLPGEKQQEELQKFLKTLNPEQIKYLQEQQQEQGCPFCLIAEGKIESYKIYEDDFVIAVLDIKPANEGHVLVLPKTHVQKSIDLNDEHIFSVANKIAKRINEILGKDTNIFAANGENAGQRVGHLMVHVIPRDEDDGLNFEWKGKTVDKKDFDELKKKLHFKEERNKPEIKELDEDFEEKFLIP